MSPFDEEIVHKSLFFLFMVSLSAPFTCVFYLKSELMSLGAHLAVPDKVPGRKLYCAMSSCELARSEGAKFNRKWRKEKGCRSYH